MFLELYLAVVFILLYGREDKRLDVPELSCENAALPGPHGLLHSVVGIPGLRQEHRDRSTETGAQRQEHRDRNTELPGVLWDCTNSTSYQ